MRAKSGLAILLLLAVAVGGVPRAVNADQLHVSVSPTPVPVGKSFMVAFWIEATGSQQWNGQETATVHIQPSGTFSDIWQSAPMKVGPGLDYEVYPPGISTPGTYEALVAITFHQMVGNFAIFQVVSTTTTTPTLATDWAVLSVSLSPSAPHVGDPVTFSMVMTALLSPGPFPQSFAAVCQIDGISCGGGSLTYPGPLNTPFTVSAQTPWIATSGTHTLNWGVATIPVGLDPNKGNNMKSITFTVAQPPPQQTTTVSSTAPLVPDFQINVSPPSQTVLQDQTVSYAVNVAGLNGFNSQVSLSVSGLPSGANGVFSNPSGTPNFASTLTVILSGDVATGSYTLTVTGSGGGSNHVANLVLTVNAAKVMQTSTSSTETSASSTQTSADLMGMIQQNQLLILAAVVLLAAVLIAVALRGRRKPTPTQPMRTGITTGTVYCGKCGVQNPTANEFCAKCGAKLH